ncbi:LLM class flavin-dependent oxidoreductase [Chryseolinea sp. H1M3-3]|uniref:LLM class flavin-dependent oxidoreductase n=1 Tax=Chryseolinea sp. H1M3-3 TaxID=3034144 RepID=UPI0023ECC25E|nr:LLM class flavin-dependent oxidoreductase [Chryseolinea sp. H1M3-3]
MELGLYTFADMQPDKVSGKAVNAHKRMQQLLEEIQLADQLGLDVFAVGEHHRPDYAISAPAVVLGAAAALTKNIKLSSAVTVLSSDDPVRVFQNFATVDLLSSGRAEIMVGRGSFIESFPLFGYDLNQYDELFAEKLELLLKVNQNEITSWKGKHRSSIMNLGVYPRPIQQALPIWQAVGGTPQSAIRAGSLGLPMALAIIGGYPDKFVPFINLYRDTANKAGHGDLPLGINSHVYVAETSQQAGDEFYPAYSVMMNRIGRERGWGHLRRMDFDAMRSPTGSLVVGSVDEVVDKILYEHSLFNNTRFLAQMSVGLMPHDKILKSIELFGTKVAPAVRKATAVSKTEKKEVSS